jgi:hypothetical protein
MDSTAKNFSLLLRHIFFTLQGFQMKYTMPLFALLATLSLAACDPSC